jgi:hypothetical protein
MANGSAWTISKRASIPSTSGGIEHETRIVEKAGIAVPAAIDRNDAAALAGSNERPIAARR